MASRDHGEKSGFGLTLNLADLDFALKAKAFDFCYRRLAVPEPTQAERHFKLWENWKKGIVRVDDRRADAMKIAFMAGCRSAERSSAVKPPTEGYCYACAEGYPFSKTHPDEHIRPSTGNPWPCSKLAVKPPSVVRADEIVEACASDAQRMADAASGVLQKSHDDDAAAQFDTANEIVEAIRARKGTFAVADKP
jgi:hypothetical protein